MKGCRSMTDGEVAQVCAHFQGTFALRNKALFLLGVKSGFRISELLALRVGDVYRQGHWLAYVTVPKRHMKQRLESRRVPLHPQAREALEAWLTQWGSREPLDARAYLFRSRKGANQSLRPVQAWQVLQEVFRRCGLRASWARIACAKRSPINSMASRSATSCRPKRRSAIATCPRLPTIWMSITRPSTPLSWRARSRGSPAGHRGE